MTRSPARFILTAVLAASTFPPALQAQSSAARSLQEDFVRVAQTAKQAVVNIATIHEQEYRVVAPPFFFGDPDEFLDPYGAPRSRVYKHRTAGVGSGFIIDDKGHVLTNYHVVRDASEIRVTLTKPDGKDETLPGKVIGRDSNLDLAVVQIQAKRQFPYLKFADSDKVRVGHWAVAVGSPFGLEHTVTAGIISAVRQSLNIEGRPYHNMLQTDAAINQGNSGGPLLDLDGEVVGVNTAIYSPSGAFAGIGFAIPINEVKLALEYLLTGSSPRRGWLGVEVAPVDAVLQRKFSLPEPAGAIVNAVVPGSPAARAGLERGDVLWTFNDAEILSPQDLVARVSRLAPGSRVELAIYRRGARKTLQARLAERPSGETGPAARAQNEPERPEAETGRGLTWEGVTFEERPGRGVRVARVDPSSTFKGTLMEGDVIRGIDKFEIAHLRDLQEALTATQLSEGAVFDVLRRGRPMFLSIRTQ